MVTYGLPPNYDNSLDSSSDTAGCRRSSLDSPSPGTNNDNNNKNNKVAVDLTVVCRRTRTLRTVESVVHKPFQHQVDGRYAKTLKVYYHDCTTKEEAKHYHTRLREHILPTYFPNVTLRS
mmetsp:Transcript_41160/g.47476  ORF Transcript_41160/g.47476 Transcript_41160/m.47476 type:complete len:120 (-) Transcript_41160:175-534(-)